MIRSAILITIGFFMCCLTNYSVADERKFVEEENITGPCAVFVAPTSSQIDSLKNKLGEVDFYTSVDDYMNYISKARTFLETKKLAIINKDAVGILKFQKTDGKIFEQKVQGMIWSIILFNGKSDPAV